MKITDTPRRHCTSLPAHPNAPSSPRPPSGGPRRGPGRQLARPARAACSYRPRPLCHRPGDEAAESGSALPSGYACHEAAGWRSTTAPQPSHGIAAVHYRAEPCGSSASPALTLKGRGSADRLWAMRGPDRAVLAAPSPCVDLANSSSDLHIRPLATRRCVRVFLLRSWCRAAWRGPCTDIWRTGSQWWRRFGEPLAVTGGGTCECESRH